MAADPATKALEALEKELLSMLDTFTHLVRAAKIPDKEGEQASSRDARCAPGDLLEVWGEKLVYSAHTALHWVGGLKSRALVSDVKAMTATARSVRATFESEDAQVSNKLNTMRQEVQAMLGQLEDSYYGTEPALRGRLVDEALSSTLKGLVQGMQISSITAAAPSVT